MSEYLGNKEKVLREIIKRLHSGENASKLRDEFKNIINGLTPDEIAAVEERLINEGMPAEEIHKFCDAHLEVMQESVEKATVDVPEWHPIYILMKEHNALLRNVGLLRSTAKKLKETDKLEGENKDNLDNIITHFKEAAKHYLREENVLFPYIEKHGITQPPKIMWMEHDNIREVEKGLFELVDKYNPEEHELFVMSLEKYAIKLLELLSSHFMKENKILFPTAVKIMSEEEFKDVRLQFDEIGYCCFSPQIVKIDSNGNIKKQSFSKEKVILENGELSPAELEGIFNTIPMELTFIDKDDVVRFFTQTKEKVFIRTKAVLGRKVQQCHPQKSVHLVNKILDDFKAGKRDVAEFWITLNERFIYIRYFPVRDNDGNYIGCLEAAQDITDIKKLEGERRLLDE